MFGLRSRLRVCGHGSRVAEANALVRGATDGEAKGGMAAPEPDWVARGARALRLLNGLLDRRSNGSADALGPDTVCAPPVRAPPAAMPATFAPTPAAVEQTLDACFGPPTEGRRTTQQKRTLVAATQMSRRKGYEAQRAAAEVRTKRKAPDAASSRLTATAAALGTDERDATDLLRAVARQRTEGAGASAAAGRG